MHRRSPAAAFTLVELMIVVAIISVLSSIAGPAFADMQHKARFTEAAVNHDGIVMAMATCIAEAPAAGCGASVSGAVHPRAAPDKTPATWTSGTGFDDLPFAPDGDVRCSYGFAVEFVNSKQVVYVACNVDGDSTGMNLRSTADLRGTSESSPSTGVWCGGALQSWTASSITDFPGSSYCR